MLPSIEQRIASMLAVSDRQVLAAVSLLDEGATVPFIARYRKEVTGGLDDAQLRLLEEQLYYLRELEARRDTVLKSIEEQGKMSPELKAAVLAAADKTTLEDLYLPYRPKRRTKAQIAHEAGLVRLADALLSDPMLEPDVEAAKYILPPFTAENGENPGVPDVAAALEGARQILMERFAEEAVLLQVLRTYLHEHGVVESRVLEGKEQEGIRFSDYFDYAEPLAVIPSHRALALFRGRREEILAVRLRLDSEPERPKWDAPHNPCETRIASHFEIADKGRPADRWLMDTVRWAWRVRIFTHLENGLMTALREKAEADAIDIFAQNLKALLLAAPAGPRVTMGLDPGLRTGVKVAVVDETGKVLDTGTVFPHQPKNDWNGTISALSKLIEKHGVSLVAIGNGTASRETDRLAQDLLRQSKERFAKVMVSEAGASVYSASEYASQELPELDVSLRGAVSIARRLQDPLAELVKIDPKSIGVGQYQHDVSQHGLARTLDAVVEDCVNAIGVDVNTASAPLLARVSGIGETLAKNIVAYRDKNGRFASRTDLKSVPRLGEKTFELSAGFLRIPDGENPLDASAVHPESYPVVEKILADIKKDIKSVIGDKSLLESLQPQKYADERFGVPTVTDILSELEKPGRDPRPAFVSAAFKEGVEEIADLEPDMILEGVVTNVTAFGAFVDIGVHQDGLVHISAMSDRFVRDPHQVVSAGQIVKVKVMEVDMKRNRISLSMRLTDSSASTAEPAPEKSGKAGKGKPRKPEEKKHSPASGTAMADAFSRLKER
ncbi:RNA-binding transcriptional accessory protein [Oxalobacter sp. OttesenSCG-928-P03]|nr:RNA-binding transcriptional accessory protein [Oxalobacter sp. OttesenSCG-928-P03]